MVLVGKKGITLYQRVCSSRPYIMGVKTVDIKIIPEVQKVLTTLPYPLLLKLGLGLRQTWLVV